MLAMDINSLAFVLCLPLPLLRQPKFAAESSKSPMATRPLRARQGRAQIRLSGIDAPERKQPFGTVAREVLGELMQARDVVVEEHGQDRYRRTLGTVLVKDGNGQRTNANLQMVKLGYAWPALGTLGQSCSTR